MFNKLKVKLGYCLLLSLMSIFVGRLEAEQLPIIRGVGGDFSMQSATGEVRSLVDFQGKAVLLFFGYTNCADICPTTLAFLAKTIKKLPAETQKEIQVLFITIDPEYDTPAHLKKYLDYFDPRFIGFSDTKAKTDAIVASYQVRYNQVVDGLVTTEHQKFKVLKDGVNQSEDKSHLYTHSSSIFLMDKKGRIRDVFSTGTPVSKIHDELMQLTTSQPKKMTDPVDMGMPATAEASLPGMLKIDKGWIREVPTVSKNSAAYFQLENLSSEALQIIEIESPSVLSAEIHQNIEVNGLTKMVPIVNFVIPIGQVVKLEPTGMHLMLMGFIGNAPRVGEFVTLIFHLSNGENLRIEFPVQKAEPQVSEHQSH